MTVVSVSMPEELLERIDKFSDEHGYTGRSEVVREASRNLLGEFEDAKLEDRDLMAVVTVLFDYETTSVEERMMRLRHEHEGLVAPTSIATSARGTAWSYSCSKGGWKISRRSWGRFARRRTRSRSTTA